MKDIKTFQVRNVDSKLIQKYRDYCKQKHVDQCLPLERWIKKLVY